MGDLEAALVRRPRRWDEPLDPRMTDADAAWLRGRVPFAQMRGSDFPRATPLEGILRNDCRIRRFAPGELIVREGDYDSSEFLVLSDSVQVVLSSLPPELLGRRERPPRSWWQALRRTLQPRRWAEVRSREEVTPAAATPIAAVDDRPALFLQDFDGILRLRQTLPLGPGELFGEVAAMYRTPRSATVVAEEEATLVEIRWQGLRLLRRDPQLARQMERQYRERWLLPHLRETPLLRFLPEEALQQVAAAAQLRSFGRLEWHHDYQRTRQMAPADQIAAEPLIAMEGHLPTDLILLRNGFARVSQAHGAGHRTSAYLGKGQLYGLGELVHNALRDPASPPLPLQHSLRAVGFVDTVHIPAERVVDLVLPYLRREDLPRVPRPRGRGEDRRHARETAGRSEAALGGETALLEFIVQQRLNNGRRAMVIDLNRCTRCDDCVRACAATHDGDPRFVRTGPTHESLQFVHACMHCTDPVCMIGCPTGAIARDPHSGTVRVHEPICVGCGTCAGACPYENIRLVEVRDPQGRAYQDEATGLPIVKATKCDLCHGAPSGPACQAACPHDALVRIDLGDPTSLDQWLGQRGAAVSSPTE